MSRNLPSGFFFLHPPPHKHHTSIYHDKETDLGWTICNIQIQRGADVVYPASLPTVPWWISQALQLYWGGGGVPLWFYCDVCIYVCSAGLLSKPDSCACDKLLQISNECASSYFFPHSYYSVKKWEMFRVIFKPDSQLKNNAFACELILLSIAIFNWTFWMVLDVGKLPLMASYFSDKNCLLCGGPGRCHKPYQNCR
jgi:hypothetical protein